MMADLLAPIPKSRAHHGSPFNGLLELGILDALLQMESSMLQSKFVSLAKGNFASLPALLSNLINAHQWGESNSS